MNKDLNDLLIAEIIKRIPPEIKVIDYLKESLKISKESLYRRVRGEIPFAFDEICKLSIDLNFSIDQIIKQNNANRVYFDLQANRSTDPSRAFLILLEKHYELIKEMIKADHSEATIVLNYLLPVHCLYFDPIFKFVYYKWIHFNRKNSSRYRLCEIHIPTEINSIKEKIKALNPKVHNTSYIADQNIYLNLIKDILYYHERKLISNEELLELKQAVSDYFKLLQEQVVTTHHTFKIYNYISEISFGANCSYIEYDNKIRCHLYSLSVNPMVIESPELCSQIKEWIDSLKKYTTMITESNETLQADYFNKQYKYLELLDIN